MDELYKSLEAAKELLNDEIKKLTKKGDITPAELENMTKALCAIEKIKEIQSIDAEWDDGMSGRSYRMPGRSYGVMHYQDMQPYDMSGRHTRIGGAYDHGYSGHSIKDRMIAKLESMYDEAKTDHERQMVDEWISRLADNK